MKRLLPLMAAVLGLSVGAAKAFEQIDTLDIGGGQAVRLGPTGPVTAGFGG